MSREIVDLDRSIRMAAIMSLDARESGERQNARGERWWGVGARRTLHQPYPRALCTLPSFAGIKTLNQETETENGDPSNGSDPMEK